MQDFILDFTHVYDEEWIQKSTLPVIDCADITGCNMYCDEQAKAQLRKRLLPYGAQGIHFIDSGNYHYLTGLLLEQLREPFTLIVWDNHTDMQPPQMAGLTSCGGWFRDTLLHNTYLRQALLIGPDEASLSLDEAATYDKLTAFSAERLRAGLPLDEITGSLAPYPVYLSIDKDVLCPQDAQTNWNQGELTAAALLEHIQAIRKGRRMLGADICGEYDYRLPFTEAAQARSINTRVNDRLYRALSLDLENHTAT